MKELKLFKRGTATTLIPLYAESIHAGFESPAADYEEEKIVYYNECDPLISIQNGRLIGLRKVALN